MLPFWQFQRAPEQAFADAVQLSAIFLSEVDSTAINGTLLGPQAIRSKVRQVLKYTHRFRTLVFYTMWNEGGLFFARPAV